MATATQERRKAPRTEFPSRLAIQLLQPQLSTAPQHVNISSGGLCLRLRDMLEVRSLVRFQLASARSAARDQQSVECTGRVAWVIQRLDLRDSPPFLFDVGIEFVNTPPRLRQWLAQQGTSASVAAPPAIQAKVLAPCDIRGRRFVPQLKRGADDQQPRWHLVVSANGTPCFSGRYASERVAVLAWNRFKREQAKHR